MKKYNPTPTPTFLELYKIEPKVCDDLIEYFNDNVEYKSEGTIDDQKIDKTIKDSIDVNFYNGSKDKRIKKFFEVLSPCIHNYAWKYKIAYNMKTSDANNIQYYKPKGGFRKLHYESSPFTSLRAVVYMLYLNNVTDGGGTNFPFQNITTHAVKGDLILWPADFTHPHRGVISDTQEKYICTGWFEYVPSLLPPS